MFYLVACKLQLSHSFLVIARSDERVEIFRQQTCTAASASTGGEHGVAEASNSQQQMLPQCSIAALVQTVEQLVEEMEAMPEIPDRSDHCFV